MPKAFCISGVCEAHDLTHFTDEFVGDILLPNAGFRKRDYSTALAFFSAMDCQWDKVQYLAELEENFRKFMEWHADEEIRPWLNHDFAERSVRNRFLKGDLQHEKRVVLALFPGIEKCVSCAGMATLLFRSGVEFLAARGYAGPTFSNTRPTRTLFSSA